MISNINIPIIFGGVGYNEIKAGPLLNNFNSKNRYIKNLKSLIYKPYKPISGSIPTINNMLTSIISNEIVNYFVGINEVSLLNKEKFICTSSMCIKKQNKYD